MEIKTFNVQVVETLCRTVAVTAASEAEAVEKAKELYGKEEVILGEADFVGVEFELNSK